MKDLFPGFYDRTEEELLMLWREAIIVFDTNMLLNVYRYREETRRRFFEILEQFKDRIWIPHQVVYEYQNNRLEVITQQSKVYSEVSKALKEAQGLLMKLENLKDKHSFIRIDEIIKPSIRTLSEANDKLSADQKISKQEIEKLKAFDSYREKIAQLLQDKIGKAYSNKNLYEIYKLADKRFELQIPPGWKDKGKKTYDKYGDAILWFQLIDHARLQKRPILFVTDDRKSDWLLSIQESSGHLRPRPELVQEMFVEAGVLLHIYQGYEFISEVTGFLQLKPEPGISEDAKEVTERNALEEEESLVAKLIKSGKNAREVEKALEPQVTEAAIKWLREHSNHEKIIPHPESKTISSVLVEPSGTEIGTRVKIEFNFRWVVREINYLLTYFGGASARFAKFVLFVIYVDKSNAMQAVDLIERTKLRSDLPNETDLYFDDSVELHLPTNVSIVVGYFYEDSFIFVNSFPDHNLFDTPSV